MIDLGCGTGNALPVLAARFPEAELVGVDSSPAMLKRVGPAGQTQLADIFTWSPPEPVDVIFGDATLQWLPTKYVVLQRLLTCLAPDGILAIQMPAMHNEPVRALQSIVGFLGALVPAAIRE